MNDSAGQPHELPEDAESLSSDIIGGRYEAGGPESEQLDAHLNDNPSAANIHEIDLDIASAYRDHGAAPENQGPPESAGGEDYYAKLGDRVRIVAKASEAAALNPVGDGPAEPVVVEPAREEPAVAGIAAALPSPASMPRSGMPLRWQAVLAGAGAAAATVYVLAMITADAPSTPRIADTDPAATTPAKSGPAEKTAIAGPRPVPSRTHPSQPDDSIVTRRTPHSAASVAERRRIRAWFAENDVMPMSSRFSRHSRNSIRPMLTPTWENRLSIPERRDIHQVRSGMDEEILLPR